MSFIHDAQSTEVGQSHICRVELSSNETSFCLPHNTQLVGVRCFLCEETISFIYYAQYVCFAPLCAHLRAISNNFNCNEERILGK